VVFSRLIFSRAHFLFWFEIWNYFLGRIDIILSKTYQRLRTRAYSWIKVKQ